MDDEIADRELSRDQKLRNKLWNDQFKLLSTILHNVAIAVFGIGFLRYAFDSSLTQASTIGIVVAISMTIALEMGALYMLRLQRSEN